MAVEFVAAGATTDAAQVNRPAGLQVGDLMIAAVANREARTDSTISGWTKLTQPASSGANSSSMGVFWKPYASGDPASWAVNTSGAAAHRTTVLGYRGADLADPVEVYSTNSGTGGTKTWLSVSPVDSRLVVMFVSVVFHSITNPTGVTERWALVPPASGDVTGWGGDKVVSAGATGSFTAGALDGNGWATVLLAVRGSQWSVGFVGWN